MKILVTGSTGYVGKAIYNYFSSDKGSEVYGIGSKDCDLTDINSVKEYFKGKYFDVLIHCAAKIGGRVVEENDSILAANLKMYYNLLEVEYSYDKFINIGSGAEDSRTHTPYGLSKRIIRDDIYRRPWHYNLRVWGLFDENELDSRFIKTCIKSKIAGKAVSIMDRRMDYIYMGDFLWTLRLLIDNISSFSKEVNCVYKEPVWLSDIAKMVGCSYYIDGYEEEYIAIDRHNISYNPIIGLEAGIKNTYKKILEMEKTKNLTVVTGLWDISREGRPFDHYIDNFRKFLDIPCNLFIYIEEKNEYLIWENNNRTKENTYVKIYSLEDVKSLYSPFWDQTQKIRVDPEWYNLAHWLPGAPQASNEWYNPIVQSKIFMMHDVTIWNPFLSKYFLWLDAGLTNTVSHHLLKDTRFYHNIVQNIDPFLFVSYKCNDGVGNGEIHGMKYANMKELAGEDVLHVCRGGLFGGTKKSIDYAHSTYYGLLGDSLRQGVMGTEESIFAIMSYLRPNYFRRYELPGTIIADFVDDVINNGKVRITGENRFNKEYHGDVSKTAIYFLTFNKPKQLDSNLSYMRKWNSDWLDNTSHKYVIDNTTDTEIIKEMAEVCEKHGVTHLPQGKNIGIFWGRKKAAEHFDSLSDCDFYVFFEDDMFLNGIEDPEIPALCRNGFNTKVGGLWDKVHNIMVREDLDFLKLTFTEVFLDNNQQVSWYNVSDEKRREYWPNYFKLPIHGFDPDCPRTRYEKIDSYEGLSYAVGQPYYCNWPILMSKRGNKRVFLEDQPSRPDERAQMGCVFERQVGGEIRAGVLLASTITHGRSEHYEQKDRLEG